jgi:hypothetical protein
MKITNLPPALQTYLDDYLPILKDIAQHIGALFEPVYAQLKPEPKPC